MPGLGGWGLGIRGSEFGGSGFGVEDLGCRGCDASGIEIVVSGLPQRLCHRVLADPQPHRVEQLHKFLRARRVTSRRFPTGCWGQHECCFHSVSFDRARAFAVKVVRFRPGELQLS